MDTITDDFVPVLLGTEIGAYGMARAFWEAYGKRSVCYGTFPLTPTACSKFIEQRCHDDLMEPDRFVQILNDDARLLGGRKALVIPCGDDYSLILGVQKERLCDSYLPVCSSSATLKAVSDKDTFYQFCEKAQIPYPRTVVVDGPEVPELPFGYPVAVKPTDAASYREHEFEGQKKAFILEDEAMLAETLRRVYAAGYDAKMVIQDFIPGGDDNMRVLNGYVRSDGSLALMSLGHPVLEDCEPMRIGNYVGIYSYGDDAVYDMVEQLMSHVDYFGYFNLDMKYDERDGTFKVFDFNPRQGRSSFFTTLSGHNLATYAVRDLVEGDRGPCERGTNEVLWVGVPRRIVRKYTPAGPARDHALALMRQGKVGTTLFGAHDNAPKRLVNMGKLWAYYVLDFRKYFGHKELEA